MKLKLFRTGMLLAIFFLANAVQAQKGAVLRPDRRSDSLDPTRILRLRPAELLQVPDGSEHGDAEGKSKSYRFQTVDFPGAAYSQAYDVSDGNKTVVGFTLYDPRSTPHISFTFKGTKYKTVSIPGSSDNGLTGINHSGQMVGFYTDSSGNLHGFRDDSGNVTSIDYPGAVFTEAIDINDSGLVAGWFGDPTTAHGFTYNGSKFTKIDYPGSTATAAYGINSAGEIVGVWFDQSSNEHSFLLSGGTFTSLDYPSGHITQASGINDLGEIAGTYRDSNNGVHGFVYSGGTWTTIDVTGAASTGLNRIKNNHELAGWFSDAIGETHGVIGH